MVKELKNIFEGLPTYLPIITSRWFRYTERIYYWSSIQGKIYSKVRERPNFRFVRQIWDFKGQIKSTRE